MHAVAFLDLGRLPVLIRRKKKSASADDMNERLWPNIAS
jgi:hypothetical protein